MRVHLVVPLVVVPLAAAFLASDARASRSVAAGACVPSIQTLEELKYRVVNGAYEFADGETGTLRFTCPVPLPDSVGSQGKYGWMRTANDGDGAATGTYVRAEFKRVHKATGVMDTECTMFSQSSTFAPMICQGQPGVPRQMLVQQTTYFHFVEVTIYRNAVQPPGESIRFYSLEWTPY